MIIFGQAGSPLANQQSTNNEYNQSNLLINIVQLSAHPDPRISLLCAIHLHISTYTCCPITRFTNGTNTYSCLSLICDPVVLIYYLFIYYLINKNNRAPR